MPESDHFQLWLLFDKPHIVGILNVTPDSFSDGGLFFEESKAYDQAKLMVESGATVIAVSYTHLTLPTKRIV